VNALIASLSLPNRARRARLQQTLEVIQFHQARSRTARRYHTPTTLKKLEQLGINLNKQRSWRAPQKLIHML